ncbi:hypothetical protein BDZ91DRAFT_479542 [Kalaharituber pfeilii]|nr:hypothetical protein BDZ91DRAFT_479542 [Kalaharituber pfeilii]
MKSPSSPAGQQPTSGRDAVCPECGRTFRDMKAHTLTHKLERPEKCPISTCEYSKKGFARKYDCQRHTLTHYKGTMVCGFCPCAGSPSEKSFNRADVFKRHLLSVHQVEQTLHPKKQSAPERYGGIEGAGKCSTCLKTFSTAQQLYEHLDDCVFRKVVEEEPGAAHNVNNMNQVKLETIKVLLSSIPGKRRGQKHSPTNGKIEEDEEDGNQEPGDPQEGTEDKNAKGETGKGISKIKPNRKRTLETTLTSNVNGVKYVISAQNSRFKYID